MNDPDEPTLSPPSRPFAAESAAESVHGVLDESTAGMRGRRVIAIGGGRGGVGKTLLTVNLGVFFAQLGRSVVVCDADPFGSNLHAVLGLESPPLAVAEDFDPGKTEYIATTVPGLRVLPIAFDPLTATAVRPTRRLHWTGHVQRIEADYVLLNLGSSTAPSTLDLFRRADVGVCVTSPEPPAIESTYRFLRALFARDLRRALMKERFKLRIVERALATLPPDASPREIISAIRRIDDGIARTAAIELARLVPRLVVGQTRLRSDLDLGNAMSIVSERYLGVAIDYIGHVEQDDAVWLTVRRGRPLLIDSPTSKSARNIERVARRILALLAAPSPRIAEATLDERPRTLYEVLGVTRGAADDEIRRAYKRQREIFRAGSLPIVSVVPMSEVEREQARIEEAHDTLLDPVRRRAYDRSAFADDAPHSLPSSHRSSEAAQAEYAMLQAELAREITPETEFTGALIRRVRDAQGLELSEIAQKTKISMAHLAAIEAETYADLPAPVYVQGFVQQVAKFLKLDAAQVSKTYMRRLREDSSGARTKLSE